MSKIFSQFAGRFPKGANWKAISADAALLPSGEYREVPDPPKQRPLHGFMHMDRHGDGRYVSHNPYDRMEEEIIDRYLDSIRKPDNQINDFGIDIGSFDMPARRKFKK